MRNNANKPQEKQESDAKDFMTDNLMYFMSNDQLRNKLGHENRVTSRKSSLLETNFASPTRDQIQQKVFKPNTNSSASKWNQRLEA